MCRFYIRRYRGFFRDAIFRRFAYAHTYGYTFHFGEYGYARLDENAATEPYSYADSYADAYPYAHADAYPGTYPGAGLDYTKSTR